MEEVAEREVAAWRPHERFGLHERTQALTLEIILRAVFGLAAGPQLDELRVTLKQLLDLGASPLTLLPPFRRRLGPLTTWARFVDVRGARRRADPRAGRRAPARGRGRPTTCSRCCSPPATRTGSR